MKKKLLAVLMAATMVLSLTACGGNKDAGTTQTPAGETAEAEEPAAEPLKIGLVTDLGGVEDQSFNQSAWEGLQRAAEDFGVEVQYLSSATDADYAPNLETFVDEEFDLIISVGFLLSDATRAAA